MKLTPLNEVYMSKLRLVENSAPTVDCSGVLNTVEGPFAEIDNKNRNGRIYKKSLWEKVINSDYVKEMMLENKSLYGEGDHPKERFEISIPNISHVVTDLWIDEANSVVMGKADILDTPVGRIVNTLVEYGSNVGISARAAGSLKEENGAQLVNEDDYTFFTFDFVPNPGFKSSRLQKNDTVKLAASNTPDVEVPSQKEFKNSLKEQIESIEEENLEIVEKIIGSLPLNEKNYKELIDKIEERKKGDNSSQENTLSLLEKSYRKSYDLEKENISLQEKIKTLKDEVNRLSDGVNEKALELKSDVEIYEFELVEAKDRINKLESLISEYKTLLKSKDRKSSSIDEGKLKSLDEELIKLKRESKSKLTYAQLMEERVKEISEEKVILEKKSNDLDRKYSKLLKEYEELESENSSLNESIESITENDKISQKSLEDLAEKYIVFENYIISQIAGRVGVDIELVKKYIPENFTLDDIEEVERKLKRSVKKDTFEFNTPIKVKGDLNGVNNKDNSNSLRLQSLVSNVRHS